MKKYFIAKLRKGFTLIELLAALAVLAFIMTIAVTNVLSLIHRSSEEAFKSDAKMVITGILYQKGLSINFDVTTVNETNVAALLGISDNNYQSISVDTTANEVEIVIRGKNKWDGLVAHGTINSLVVQTQEDYDRDTTAPVVTLIGNSVINIEYAGTYTESGATAIDDKNGNVTALIVVGGSVNTSLCGAYLLTYTAIDSSGNEGFATRTVNIIDSNNPTYTSYAINNITDYTYDVYVYGVSDVGSGINRVQFGVWTTWHGQDDLPSDYVDGVTSKGTNMGSGTWKFTASRNNHGLEGGEYNTVAYIYDNYGASTTVNMSNTTLVDLYYYDKYNTTTVYSDTAPWVYSYGGTPDFGSGAYDGYSSYTFNSATNTYGLTGTYGRLNQFTPVYATWFAPAGGVGRYDYLPGPNTYYMYYKNPASNSSSSQKTTIVQSNIVAYSNTYPLNGKHTDNFWYVRTSNIGSQYDYTKYNVAYGPLTYKKSTTRLNSQFLVHGNQNFVTESTYYTGYTFDAATGTFTGTGEKLNKNTKT